MRFSGAQLEVGTYPTSLIVSTSTSVARNSDQISATVPAVPAGATGKWCVAGTYQPLGTWVVAASRLRWNLGTISAANSSQASVEPTIGLSAASYNAAAAVKYVAASTAAFVADSSHRIVDCNNAGTISIYDSSALVSGAASGAGTGIVTTSPTTLYFGNASTGGTAFGGFVKSLKICGPAKNAKECR
jgi:hypothetical protein